MVENLAKNIQTANAFIGASAGKKAFNAETEALKLNNRRVNEARNLIYAWMAMKSSL